MIMTHPHVIILLAGQGSRLKPLTDHTHKALIPLGDKNILQRQLEVWQRMGLKNFTLILGYRANDIKKHIQDHHADLNVNFVINDNFAQTNTAYSLSLALAKITSSFILADGDVVLDEKLASLLLLDPEQNRLLCETDRERLNAEAVKVIAEQNHFITKIGKNIPLNDAAGESIGIGLFQSDWARKLNQELEKVVNNPQKWSWYYEDAFQELIEKKQTPSPLKIVSTQGLPWVEIDDHDDLQYAQKVFV